MAAPTSMLPPEAKAEALLESWLSPLQLEEYQRNKAFHVIGNVSKKRYRIVNEYSYNIWEVTRDGTVIERYCLTINNVADYPNTFGHPHADIMLAQKIALETDERRAIKTANPKRLHGWFKTFFFRLFANSL